MDGAKQTINPADDNYLIPTVIKTDVNLSRLPFFALVHSKLKHFKIDMTFVETHGNERLELGWKVTANPEYGFPGLLAKRVHKAIEYLLIRNGTSIPEYLDFSLYEIIKILGLEPSGRTRAQIKQAILSIASTTIESKGTYCYLDDGDKQWVEDYFHLYERVVLAGRRFPDGTVAEQNRVYLGEWYRKSLDSGYVKPLDFSYWNTLNGEIARRLYEYLSFISYATKCKSFKIEYHKLCEFLPITPQRYFSKAKQILSRAHRELIDTGFLNKVVWQKSKTDAEKWIIIYSFGSRARSELARGFRDDTYRPALLAVEAATVEEIEEQTESEEKEGKGTKTTHKRRQAKKQLSSIAQQLYDRGLSRSIVLDFAGFFPEDYIQEKIRLHDEMKGAGELTQNAAGWLRGAIEDDYQLAPEQRRRLQAKTEREEREATAQALRERAKAIQTQRIEAALKRFPTIEEWADRQIEKLKYVRGLMIEQFPEQKPVTAQEIEQVRQTAIKAYPQTEQERLAEIRRNPADYNADFNEILEALKKEARKQAHEDRVGKAVSTTGGCRRSME